MFAAMTRLSSSLRLVGCVLALLGFVACGPGRTAYARYPGAPAEFDRTASDPKAIEIAEKVFAAAGGPGNWDAAKQITWRQVVTVDGNVRADAVQVWDRWNARHYGRLRRGEDTEYIVAYDLYGSHVMGFVQKGKKQQNFDEPTRKQYVGVARDGFNETTAVLALQFLMLEPGAKLEYIGGAIDDAGEEHYDELKVTFADDPMRKGLELHPIIDRNTNLPVRIEIYKAGTREKIGYTLSDWTTVNGLKFARARGNLGYSGEAIAISDIAISDPDDNLFIAPITH
jgi:hypothetical protein